MRKDVKKVLIWGLVEDQEAFYRLAQEAGYIHFINHSPSHGKEGPPIIVSLSHAIKILRALPPVEQEESEDYEKAESLTKEIISIRQQLDRLDEEERTLKMEMRRVKYFGNFSAEDIAFIEQQGKRKVQFFTAKHGLEIDSETLLLLGTDEALDYYLGIHPVPFAMPELTEMQIEKPIGQLEVRYTNLLQAKRDLEQLLQGYAKWNLFLHHALIHYLNHYQLHHTQNYSQFLLGGALFMVEAWVPVGKAIPLLDSMHVEDIAAETDEVVPTYLDNNGVSRIGEDLVHIYDTPANNDRDPSLWVLFFFSFFFAFIVGDAGYGLIMLAVALYIRYRTAKMTILGTRMWKLFVLLSAACIIWGTLITSFFGIPFAPDSPLRRVSLIQWLAEKEVVYHYAHQDKTYTAWLHEYPQIQGISDPQSILQQAEHKGDYELLSELTGGIMLELALFIGVVHVLLSLLRYLDRNASALGWILFIIGGYLYLPGYLGATSLIHYLFGVNPETGMHVGLQLLLAGLFLAIATSIYHYKWVGIFEAMTAIQIFGDIMSYLRLYALGLSGGIVSATINDLAASSGLVIGFILIVIGHTLNIALAIMGGVIHGLRLNFLEWYHYSFYGGGKLFQPLKKIIIE